MKPKVKHLFKQDTEILLSWGFKLFILLSGIYLVVWQREYYWAANCFISFAVSMLPVILSKSYKVNLPWFLDMFITLTILTNVLGYSFDWYARIWWWDLVVHTTHGMLVALLAFIIVFVFNYHTTKVKLDRRMMFIFIIAFALSMGVVVEYLEWGIDKLVYGEPHEQGSPGLSPLDDTMKDLVVDALAGIVVAVAGVFWLKHTPKEKLRRDLNSKQLVKFVEKTF
jgi:hypothetical protein